MEEKVTETNMKPKKIKMNKRAEGETDEHYCWIVNERNKRILNRRETAIR